MFQVIVSILVAVCLVHWLIPCRANPKEHFPPGPRPRPIIGNLFDLTLKEFWLRVASWAQEYGNVIHLRLFNKDLVFLSSIETAVDLLEKRGAVYADRLQTTMASELCGVSKIIAFTSYNHPNYQRERRMMHHALAPAKMQTYHPLMTDETSKFLKTMLDSPENYVHNIKRFTGSQIMSIVYGYEVTKDDEPYLKTAEEILFVLSNHIMPVDNNVWLVDIFPWLKHIPLWFPGSGFKSKAGAWREKMEQCANEPFEWVKERMRSGTATPCYCTGLLTEGEQDAYDAGMADPQHERSIRWTANSFYIASVDTTLVLLGHFILAMVQYPDVARKAQEALDDVTRMTRLPTFEDRDALPYIDAVFSECMRWTSPVPLGLPHRVMEDDVYNDMAIPKGALVLANVWSISRDPVLFPDPDAFIPERYLEQTDEATARKRDPRSFIFGFGRRKCPGMHLADASLWLAIARLLATFDFGKAKDAEGRDIEPQPEYNDASFRLLEPFPCVIRPRSERAAQLVHDALSACT